MHFCFHFISSRFPQEVKYISKFHHSINLLNWQCPHYGNSFGGYRGRPPPPPTTPDFFVFAENRTHQRSAPKRGGRTSQREILDPPLIRHLPTDKISTIIGYLRFHVLTTKSDSNFQLFPNCTINLSTYRTFVWANTLVIFVCELPL